MKKKKTLKKIQAKPQAAIWGILASFCVYCLVFLWRKVEISFSSQS